MLLSELLVNYFAACVHYVYITSGILPPEGFVKLIQNSSSEIQILFWSRPFDLDQPTQDQLLSYALVDVQNSNALYQDSLILPTVIERLLCTQATVTNLYCTSATITNFNISNFNISNGTITNFSSTTATISNLLISNINTPDGTITNFNSTNATITNIYVINFIIPNRLQHVDKTSAQTISNNTDTAITFDTTNKINGPSYYVNATNTTRWTNNTGKTQQVQFTYNVSWTAAQLLFMCQAWINYNGSSSGTARFAIVTHPNASVTNVAKMTGTIVLSMAPSTYVELYAYQNSGSSKTIGGTSTDTYSYMQCFVLSG